MTAPAEPTIRFSCTCSVAPAVVQPIIEAFAEGGVRLEVEYHDPPGPWAAIEWYIPTAAFLYLAKGYFDGFLKELGKDHYNIVKAGLASLWSGFFGDNRAVRLTILSSAPGKVGPIRTYSVALSVVAQGTGNSFKSLLREDSTKSDLEAAAGHFWRLCTTFTRGP